MTNSKEIVDVTKYDIATLGNGNNEPLNQDQFHLIHQLYVWAVSRNNENEDEDEVRNTRGASKDDHQWCDRETCRRYLVARKWDFEAAKAQLQSTMEWRSAEQMQLSLKFWQSPKALANPLALSMRVVGWDIDGRPIVYTCFSQANDRWDVESNILHFTLILEACCEMLLQRRRRHDDQPVKFNETATSRQLVWVIDFGGFGWRDQNPKSALHTSRLLQRYPEMLYLVLFINAPVLFSATYKLVVPLLDDRVKEKIMFAKDKILSSSSSKGDGKSLRNRLGDEAVDWIMAEVKENKSKDTTNKQYWVIPTNAGHDARGIKSFVHSEFYIKTPGDAWQEKQQKVKVRGKKIDSISGVF